MKSNGTLKAAQLFAPYGTVRYSQGTMPTTHNFTGQRLDSQTGLLYYNARYYDPVSGRFTRADTVQNNTSGMDPYGYVGGNPETRNDPTGKMRAPTSGCYADGGCGGSESGNNNHNTTGGYCNSSGCSNDNGQYIFHPVSSNSSKHSSASIKRLTSPPPCDLKCHADRANKSVHNYDTNHTLMNSVLSDGITVTLDIASLVLDWGNLIGMVADITSLVSHLIHLAGDWMSYTNQRVPQWLQSAMFVADFVATGINAMKSVLFIASGFSAGLRDLFSSAFEKMSIKDIIVSGFMSIGNSGLSYALLSQDIINQQEDTVSNGTPTQQIEQCQRLRLSSC